MGNVEAQNAFIKKVVDHWSKIDVVVSNVAVNPSFGPMMQTSDRAWNKIFDVNLFNHFTLIKQCVPHMAPGSSVVIVSSIGGYQPFKMLGAYSVSKTALLGLTRALAIELADDNIRVNAIAPGVIKTRFSSALWKDRSASEDNGVVNIPMKRYGTPDECGAVIAFLASSDASYITGESVAASGGIHSRL
jgi:dehydrogenase/reductase SDR family member 4